MLLPGAPWSKSSRSAATNCVEVACLDDRIAVRDSYNPLHTLEFSHDVWRSFIASIVAEGRVRP